MPVLAQSPLVRPSLLLLFLFINCSVHQHAGSASGWLFVEAAATLRVVTVRCWGQFCRGPFASPVFALWDNCWHRRSSFGGGTGWASQSRGCPWVSGCLPALSIPICLAAGQPWRDQGRDLGARYPGGYGMALAQARYLSVPQFSHHYSIPWDSFNFIYKVMRRARWSRKPQVLTPSRKIFAGAGRHLSHLERKKGQRT